MNGDILLSSSVIQVLEGLWSGRDSSLFDHGVLLCGRVNEVPFVRIDTSTVESYQHGFESSFISGKQRNPFSAVLHHCYTR